MPGVSRRRTVLIALILAVVTVALYCRVVGFEFVTLDDGSYVYKNPYVKTGLTQRNVIWAFTREHSANWHPLTWISHMVDVELFGLNAAGHHATNVLLHAANTVLLFILMAAMTGFAWRSAFVAALFAVHPLHIESVAWVSERKDVLSALFWMLATLAYVGYVRRPGTGMYLLVAGLLGLGLMAKPMLVSLPLVLLMLDWWPLARGRGNGASPTAFRFPLRTLVEKLPLFGLAAASCVITIVVQQKGGAMRSVELYNPGVRVANAAVAYVAYVLKMVWPRHLAVLYPHPGDSIPTWQVAVCALVLIAATYAAIRAARSAPYVTVGWLWYVVTLIPVIGLIQVGQQAMADRYTYIPLIGLFIIVAWGAPDILARLGVRNTPAVLGVPAAAVLAALMLTTVSHLRHWRSGVTLMRHALVVSEGHEMLHHTLADALFEAGKPDEAIRQYRLAVKKNPNFAEAYNGMGYILMRQGKTREAEANYRKAIRLKPDLASAHNNLGQCLLSRGQTDEAIVHLKKAISLKPDSAEAMYNLGTALGTQGKIAEAASYFRSALRADPEMAEAHCSLGTMLLRLGEDEEAAKELAEALRIKPDLAEAHFSMAYLLSAEGSVDEAISHLNMAVRIKPRWGLAHYSLALAHCRKSNYREAWKELRRAQEYGCSVDPEFVKALSRRIPDSRKE